MYRFDHPQVSETLTESFLSLMVSILIQPYGSLTRFLSLHSRWLDFTCVALNSLVWGVLLALVIARFRRASVSQSEGRP